MVEAMELQLLIPVDKDVWESLDQEARDQLVWEQVWFTGSQHGEVVVEPYDDFGYTVHEEERIQGFRLFSEDEDGNVLPERVTIRASVFVVPFDSEEYYG